MEVSARRRPTLSHQFSMIDSCNLRDLLKVREGEDEIRHGETTVTLATILACEKQRDLSSSSSSSTTTTTTRTLLDIIRDEDDPRSLVIRGDHGGSQRISWKSFKDRLRLRRAAAAWPNASADSTSTTITITHNHGEDRSPPPSLGGGGAIAIVEARTVAGNRPSSATQTPVPDAGPSGSAGRRRPEQRLQEEPSRVSLMALLEQNDRMGNGSDNLQGTSTIATAMIGMVEEDGEVLEEEEEEEERLAAAAAVDVSGEEKGTYVCCVCMVRHKGAAFIPCGHTFCRLCSRELWVSRGICPLCNGFILEILDIF